jgi:hypothetical protein
VCRELYSNQISNIFIIGRTTIVQDQLIAMQLAVGANRFPKYWIKFLAFCNALHYSALDPQKMGKCGKQWRNAM